MKYLLISFKLLLFCSLFNSVNALADMLSDSATIKDVDGNIYPTVTIGQQQWMAENLKTTRYNDGTPVTYPGTDNTAWSKNVTGAYAWYNNDETTYRDTYGALYNWYAVNTGKLCPAGWHVPSYAEWTIMLNHLGGGYKAGGKFKEVGTVHWKTPNIEATNESGFSALPGGGRDLSGRFFEKSTLGRWGSSSEYDNRYVWGIGAFNVTSSVHRGVHFKEGGVSIRCVRNSQGVYSNIIIAQKPRVIHLIDIGKYPHMPEIDKKDPDDRQTLVRALLYANEMDIEGLIATASWTGQSSTYNQQGAFPESIKAAVDGYAKVLDNFNVHDKGWPTAEYLYSVIKRGNPAVSVPFWSGDHMDVVGDGKDTEASDHILSRILDTDPRSLWFCVWGKSIDLAQALWKLKRDYPFKVEELTGKILVYDIAGQDACGAWIAGTFPRIKWYRAMYNVISWANVLASIDNIGDLSVISMDWWDRHVRGIGIMGELYPIKTHEGNWEGDTPSFLPFTDRGLSDPENLHYGGWGGRYMQNPTLNMPAYVAGIDRFQKKYEPFFMYEPAGDTWCYMGNIYSNDTRVPIGRFRTAIQNDFAARMLWTVNPVYSDANHPPVVIINGNPGRDFVYLSVAPGGKVQLTARGSSDTDGDNLSFQWWRYAEADSYDGNINIHHATSQDAHFLAPDAPGTNIHIILEVTDHGSPRLTSYRRMIITIK